jgi:hypothetical protein
MSPKHPESFCRWQYHGFRHANRTVPRAFSILILFAIWLCGFHAAASLSKSAFQYDGASRLKNTVDATLNTLFRYDANGNLTNLIYPGKRADASHRGLRG